MFGFHLLLTAGLCVCVCSCVCSVLSVLCIFLEDNVHASQHVKPLSLCAMIYLFIGLPQKLGAGNSFQAYMWVAGIQLHETLTPLPGICIGGSWKQELEQEWDPGVLASELNANSSILWEGELNRIVYRTHNEDSTPSASTVEGRRALKSGVVWMFAPVFH